MVFEAIKRWRANKTTIVITHDLSQISSDDFVYVLKGGEVVEQGYRYDLESIADGEFREMMHTQGATGGFLPEKDIPSPDRMDKIEEILGLEEKEMEEESLARPILRPITLGNWMFDVVADLTGNTTNGLTPAVVAARDPSRISRFVPADAFSTYDAKFTSVPQRRSSLHVPPLVPPSPAHTVAMRRLSLQFTPTSPAFSFHTTESSTRLLIPTYDDEVFDLEKEALKRNATFASTRRNKIKPRARWDHATVAPLPTTIKIEKLPSVQDQKLPQSFKSLLRDIYPTIPYKPLVLLGLIFCLLSGAMTPVFSFLLSRLLFEVSVGAKDTSTINKYGGIVLSIAALDGLFIGLKYFVMETTAMSWVTRIRKSCYKSILMQDKKWFDKSENSPVRLVQVLIKDGDDARNLIAVVAGQCCVVVAMLGVGLVWALIQGWQLTLVGFAIAPVFAFTMAVQTKLVAKCELRNKRAREDVAKGYYEVSFF